MSESNPNTRTRNHFIIENENELRKEIDEIGLAFKSRIFDRITKKVAEIEFFLKEQNDSRIFDLRNQNRELKSKLFDCVSRLENHEREMVTAREALEDLLAAYTDLVQRHRDKVNELESVRSELDRYSNQSNSFRIKNEPIDQYRMLPNKNAFDRARDAIGVLDAGIRSIVSARMTCVPHETTNANSNMSQCPSCCSGLVNLNISQQGVGSPMSMNRNNQICESSFPAMSLKSESNSRRSESLSISNGDSMCEDNDLIYIENTTGNRKRSWSQLSTISRESIEAQELDADIVNRLFLESGGSATIFSSRLLKHYFSESELLRDCNVRGNRATRKTVDCNRGRKERLDPARIELIRRHVLDKYMDNKFNEELWTKCVARMNAIMNLMRKTTHQSNAEINTNEINNSVQEPTS